MIWKFQGFPTNKMWFSSKWHQQHGIISINKPNYVCFNASLSPNFILTTVVAQLSHSHFPPLISYELVVIIKLFLVVFLLLLQQTWNHQCFTIFVTKYIPWLESTNKRIWLLTSLILLTNEYRFISSVTFISMLTIS